MNKPVYYMGMTGFGMVWLFMGSICLAFLVHVWALVFSGALLSLYLVRYRAWRKGNPNLFVSWRVWIGTPGKIIDKDKILGKL